MQRVSLEEAQQRFTELIEAVLQGDTVQITTRRGTVQLSAVPAVGGRRRFGSARGLVVIHEDFDAPIEDFAAYTQ